MKKTDEMCSLHGNYPGVDVIQVKLDLHAFKNHPFKVEKDQALFELRQSIESEGILAPLLVRKSCDGAGYEIVSGYRRKEAALWGGLERVPVIVKELSDDQAIIAMVDSNLHREKILPSEKAFAYKLKADALKHQGQRTDITSEQIAPKLSTEVIGEQEGISKDTVKRYIRLTYLIPEFLEKMDKGEIALSVGVELSFLDESSQREVLEQCVINDCTPSYSQAWRMHKADREGALTKVTIQTIMSEEKANQRETVKVPISRLRGVLPQGLDAKKTEDFIIKACNHYRKYLIRQRNRDER